MSISYNNGTRKITAYSPSYTDFQEMSAYGLNQAIH
jgi:hypothetical protein